MKILLSSIIFFTVSLKAFAQINTDAIIGKWIAEDKNLVVEIFKVGNEFKCSVVWFDDRDDKNNSMNERCDKKNPNKILRSRKIIGLNVVRGLMYNALAEEWQGGRIYDSSTGKEWNAKAWLKDGILKVRGFWHFEFLGETMKFKKSS